MKDLSHTDFARTFGVDAELQEGVQIAWLVYMTKLRSATAERDAPSKLRSRLEKIEHRARKLAEVMPDPSNELSLLLAEAFSERAREGSSIGYSVAGLFAYMGQGDEIETAKPDAPISSEDAWLFARTYDTPRLEPYRITQELHWLADAAARVQAAEPQVESPSPGAPPKPRRWLIGAICNELRQYAFRAELNPSPVATADLRVEVIRQILTSLGVETDDLTDATIEHASR